MVGSLNPTETTIQDVIDEVRFGDDDRRILSVSTGDGILLVGVKGQAARNIQTLIDAMTSDRSATLLKCGVWRLIMDYLKRVTSLGKMLKSKKKEA